MIDFLLSHEAPVRLGAFFGVLAVMVLWEVLAPRRRLSHPRTRRWPSNLAIVALNTLIVRLVFPLAPVAFAAWAAAKGWGVFSLLDWPWWLELALAAAFLDLVIYLQHVMVHAVPLLWRLHRMHHTDLDYDVTTGARFHPIEIALSMVIKFAAIALIGAAPAAVLVFEVVLNASSMFNHGNVRLPAALDGVLRLLVVTPDMHRVHHSVIPAETNSNFGFSLSWWDRLFGTYRAQPAAGHEGMTIGIEAFRTPEDLRLDLLLVQPFLTDEAAQRATYAINRDQ
ncbi:MAG: sterol desaturase family protein [Hyphomicrobiales bacterium]|nr:sterol desaturase family protein [Hyphomicrobiales bacterium]MCP5372125.1 sterol desaturase family protein [Hyphomicrobiales bacterium]